MDYGHKYQFNTTAPSAPWAGLVRVLKIRSFNLTDNRYKTGTRKSVRNVLNSNPKNIVHDNGPQNATLAPPKYRWGLNSVNSVTKSMFKPAASGIRPIVAAMVVSNTGVMRVFAASIMA